MLRFFDKEIHNTGEDSKKAKKTKQCLFSTGGWEQLWLRGVTKGCSQKERVVEGAARGRRQHWHMSLLRLPKPAPFEAQAGLELQQVYFVKFSKRIALSWDASRGLGDPFCFGFSPKKNTTQESRARGRRKQNRERKNTKSIECKKKRRRNNE